MDSRAANKVWSEEISPAPEYGRQGRIPASEGSIWTGPLCSLYRLRYLLFVDLRLKLGWRGVREGGMQRRARPSQPAGPLSWCWPEQHQRRPWPRNTTQLPSRSPGCEAGGGWETGGSKVGGDFLRTTQPR